jgi:hypothetical protein
MRKLLGIKPQSDDMLHGQISNKATCSASTMQQVEPRLNLLFQDAQANDSRHDSTFYTNDPATNAHRCRRPLGAHLGYVSRE